MSNPWFRMYSEFRTDPKVQTMGESMQRRYIMLMCLESDGDLQKLTDSEIAFALNLTKSKLIQTKSELIQKNLIEVIDEKIHIKNWDKRQYVSDTSTDRVKKHREKIANETLQKRLCNGDVTPPDTDTDTEKDIPPVSDETSPNGGIAPSETEPPKPSRKKQTKQTMPSKHRYGQHVMLTDDEHAKLVAQFGESGFADWVSQLDLYAETKPKKFREYGSHFAVIQAWYRREPERVPVVPCPVTAPEPDPGVDERAANIAAYREKLMASKAQPWFRENVIGKLRGELNEHSFSSFVEPLLLVSVSRTSPKWRVRIFAAPELVQWVQDMYAAKIARCFNGGNAEVTITGEIENAAL